MKANVNKINWLRIGQGLSITKLCQMANISKPTMARLIKCRGQARPDTIGKIAKALEVPVQELFCEYKGDYK